MRQYRVTRKGGSDPVRIRVGQFVQEFPAKMETLTVPEAIAVRLKEGHGSDFTIQLAQEQPIPKPKKTKKGKAPKKETD